MQCPCQSGEVFAGCCEPVMTGVKPAETAEQLMRARYTAYTQVQMDFIEQTHDPITRRDIDMKASREWAESTNWQGLEILETKQGGIEDEFGTVEFKASYVDDDGLHSHHELSQFHKREGVWYYSDSSHPKGHTIVRRGAKVGRNDPCPCGSGKKSKKCCGNNLSTNTVS